ncbi:hypothetical protein H5V45_08750 [Nocardioides sp. KIGAM211]|uniref:Disulfide bond formation protein DsbA n=1 Tax=Nocardioides luti TaxID=2761101 RepID=A0A7X0RFL1_9ACTN|nr:hypothetical protein [Nocardioides luti]MBB6627408.1 hypothetical protein [Nocardioides luti]
MSAATEHVTQPATQPDVRFWFDPTCPFAWMTSKWVRVVQEQRDYDVEWRFIALRLVNRDVDYDAHFPPEYEDGHTFGLRLLRVCAHVRDEHGPEAVGRLYAALGERIFEDPDAPARDQEGAVTVLRGALAAADLPDDLVRHLDDDTRDAQLQAEGDEALALTGKDVGTPILHIAPPEGAAFFGPVISRMPTDEQAGELWDHVVGLATFPGFAELKRSLREQPQLASFGVRADEAGAQEDWHGGSRRRKK